MLWHVVKFRLRSEVSADDRAELVRMLAGLADAIPEVRFLRVSDSINEPDVVGLLTGFDDEDALRAYAVHPAHVPVVERARELAEITRLDVRTDDPPDALPRQA